ERFGDPSVQHAALAAEQAGIDRLARERVPERELVDRLLDDQTRGDQLLDNGQQGRLVQAADRAQQVEFEPSASDGGERHQVAASWTELRRSALDRVVHAARYPQHSNWLAIPAIVGDEDVARPDQRTQD